MENNRRQEDIFADFLKDAQKRWEDGQYAANKDSDRSDRRFAIEVLRIPPTTYSDIKRGAHLPDFKNFRAIAAALGWARSLAAAGLIPDARARRVVEHWDELSLKEQEQLETMVKQWAEDDKDEAQENSSELALS